MESTIGLLLGASKKAFPERSSSAYKNRLKMLAAALRHRASLASLLSAPPDSSAGRLLCERPEMVGILVWPYQCAEWSADERIARVLDHCSVIDEMGAPFVFSAFERLVLVELDDHLAGLRIVMDQPIWFMREGQLTLNAFVHSFRAFSLAFSFHRDPAGAITIVVGGIQGRSTGDPLALYRDITKALHGIRPRDLLVEILKMLARNLGVERILAVTDRQRHHRHPYFGLSSFTTNYDEIWEDRGGVRLDDRFYLLAPTRERREFDTIKPNKRSLYRRRFEFLDELERRLHEGLASAVPVQFPDS